MQYYVTYREKDIIQGPMEKWNAEDLAENLDFALEDKGYTVVSEERANQLHLLDPTG